MKITREELCKALASVATAEASQTTLERTFYDSQLAYFMERRGSNETLCEHALRLGLIGAGERVEIV